jgi:hypothetical protein
MTKTGLITALTLAVACASPLALGQPENGDREFTMAGSGTSDNGFDNTAFGMSASIGWFATDQFEWGLRQDVGVTDTDGGATDFTGGTRLFLDYHLNLGNWQPFAGVSFGALYGDNVDKTFSAGPELGIKYYVKPKTFILLNASYQFDVKESADSGTTFYTAGLGFNF